MRDLDSVNEPRPYSVRELLEIRDMGAPAARRMVSRGELDSEQVDRGSWDHMQAALFGSAGLTTRRELAGNDRLQFSWEHDGGEEDENDTVEEEESEGDNEDENEQMEEIARLSEVLRI